MGQLIPSVRPQPGKAMGDVEAGIGQTLLGTADTVTSMRIS